MDTGYQIFTAQTRAVCLISAYPLRVRLRWAFTVMWLYLVYLYLRPRRPLFYRGRHRPHAHVGATVKWSPIQEVSEVPPAEEVWDIRGWMAEQETATHTDLDAMERRYQGYCQRWADDMYDVLKIPPEDRAGLLAEVQA